MSPVETLVLLAVVLSGKGSHVDLFATFHNQLKVNWMLFLRISSIVILLNLLLKFYNKKKNLKKINNFLKLRWLCICLNNFKRFFIFSILFPRDFSICISAEHAAERCGNSHQICIQACPWTGYVQFVHQVYTAQKFFFFVL